MTVHPAYNANDVLLDKRLVGDLATDHQTRAFLC